MLCELTHPNSKSDMTFILIISAGVILFTLVLVANLMRRLISTWVILNGSRAKLFSIPLVQMEEWTRRSWLLQKQEDDRDDPRLCSRRDSVEAAHQIFPICLLSWYTVFLCSDNPANTSQKNPHPTYFQILFWSSPFVGKKKGNWMALNEEVCQLKMAIQEKDQTRRSSQQSG